jgi:hypothetical protein
VADSTSESDAETGSDLVVENVSDVDADTAILLDALSDVDTVTL